ncbi:MAG TPA: tetratricopeptide repeat protein [Polyangiaceae bacterium]|nr:tetratricopeptide repeat protein [Polyangiaceae bacterium]
MRVLVPLTLLAIGLTPSTARADGVLPSSATPVQREQAQSRFLKGKALLDGHQYEQALTELRASYEIVASPNTRLEVARSLEGLGRLVEAYAEFGRTVTEAKELAGEDRRYSRASAAASLERSELEFKLGFVSLAIQNAAESTRVTVGGEELRRAAWGEPAPVAPGLTEVVVETPGRSPVRQTVTLAAGQRGVLTLDAQSGAAIEPSPPPPEPADTATPAPPEAPADHAWMRTSAYVAAGVGAAGLVAFGVFGAMAKSTYDDLQSSCGANPCPSSKADEISSGKTKQLVANVGLAVGILGAVSGVTLFVLSPRGRTAQTGTALVVSPGWLGVRGQL